MWSRSRGIDVIWANILFNILSKEWESKVVFAAKLSSWKKIKMGNDAWFFTKIEKFTLKSFYKRKKKNQK